MNKKTFWTFLLGMSVSAIVFGGVVWTRSQKADVWAPVSGQFSVETLPVASVPAPSFILTELLSSKPDSHSVIYDVRPGDNLTRIAKQHNATVGLIQKINNLSSDAIRVGQKLKVPTIRFSAVVDKSQNILMLKTGEEVLKVYAVATGKDNGTPVGVFKITDRLVDPTWYKAGAVVSPGSPENVLGTRWLGIDKPGYGIHGTVEPDKIGQQATEGCVRMRNEEVEELYDFLPSGTEVTIVD